LPLKARLNHLSAHYRLLLRDRAQQAVVILARAARPMGLRLREGLGQKHRKRLGSRCISSGNATALRFGMTTATDLTQQRKRSGFPSVDVETGSDLVATHPAPDLRMAQVNTP